MLFESKEVKQKKKAVEKIVAESQFSPVYFFLLSISGALTAFGIILNSEAIIIGGMLIGPFLAPLMALALGITTLSSRAIGKALANTILSFLVLIAAGALVGISLNIEIPYEQIAIRGWFTYIYLAIALLSGAASAFLWVKPKLSSDRAGIAVSLSLIPPLSLTGLSLSSAQWDLAEESFKIFGINLIGTVIAAALVFTLMNLVRYKRFQEKEIEKAENQVTSIKDNIEEDIEG